MRCTNPISLLNPLFKENYSDIPLELRYITVPCGRCLACRIERTREWTVRLKQELFYWDKALFLTLTYNQDNMPQDGSLNKPVIQKFLKRIRRLIEPRTIKYYFVGEYGDTTFRPHYHAIIYGLSEEDRELIEKSWKYGFSYLGSVTHDSIQYVAGYIQKKYNGDLAVEVYGKKQPPFSLMSKGLGKQFVIDNKRYLEQNQSMTVNGVKTGLPRYYKKLLDIDNVKTKQFAKEKEEDIKEKLEKKGINYLDQPSYRLKAKNQHDKTLKSKNNLFKRDKI